MGKSADTQIDLMYYFYALVLSIEDEDLLKFAG
jgi:hypothetical protein